ncbi:MAG: hypothetical protein CVU46_08235 [Chloroflexi bacterium HGW-Chloroflexi-8]|jgi:hypothetical protein|nr:MAG: hypothetical protein CVU46_08235 [Chloroflexi bacterium HGW-Chloroflexi-8]
MLFEVIRIGMPVENETKVLGASIFSNETDLVWQMVILKERFSDQFVAKLHAIRLTSELESLIQELNTSGYEFELLSESIPCFGDEEELLNFIADEILVDWQEESFESSQVRHHYPEILVFNNRPENLPLVRKITPVLVDGHEVGCITVAPLNPNNSDLISSV